MVGLNDLKGLFQPKWFYDFNETRISLNSFVTKLQHEVSNLK